MFAHLAARDDGVSSGAPGGGAARTDESAYSAGLHALAVELLKRVSFSTNSAALLRLDAAGGAQFEALVDKAVDTLARIAMLDALAPRVASELAPVFGALVDGLVARPAESVASAEQALAARDLESMLRVLCSLVPFFAGKEAETFAVAAGFVEQLLAVAECCTERRLHTQGAVFRAVHVRVLSTLAVFGHWMARIQVREFLFACYSFVCSSILLPICRVVLPSPLATLAACLALGEQPRPGGGSGAPPLVEPATFARLVERAARCGIASMEGAISPPPEAVLLAAAQLLSTLSGVVRPGYIYLLWQCLQIIKTEFIDGKYLREHPEVYTSLRWIAKDRRNGMNVATLKCMRITRFMGRDEEHSPDSLKSKLAMWFFQAVFYAITGTLGFIAFHSFWFNCAYVCTIVAIS